MSFAALILQAFDALSGEWMEADQGALAARELFGDWSAPVSALFER